MGKSTPENSTTTLSSHSSQVFKSNSVPESFGAPLLRSKTLRHHSYPTLSESFTKSSEIYRDRQERAHHLRLPTSRQKSEEHRKLKRQLSLILRKLS